jgi:hypothetical protein
MNRSQFAIGVATLALVIAAAIVTTPYVNRHIPNEAQSAGASTTPSPSTSPCVDQSGGWKNWPWVNVPWLSPPCGQNPSDTKQPG